MYFTVIYNQFLPHLQTKQVDEFQDRSYIETLVAPYLGNNNLISNSSPLLNLSNQISGPWPSSFTTSLRKRILFSSHGLLAF